MPNHTLQDVLCCAWATLVFAILLLCPGYLVAWGINLFHFRELRWTHRAALALCTSFAIVPVLLMLVHAPVEWTAAGFWIVCGMTVTLLRGTRSKRRAARNATEPWLIAFFFVIGAGLVFELIDLQWGDKLYLNVATLDQEYRVAFIQSFLHRGWPPTNPLYHPGQSEPLRYYYFWYQLCAVCMRAAGVDARQTLIASSIWSAAGLVAAMALFQKHFLGVGTQISRRVFAGMVLFGVTGADLLPTLVNLARGEPYAGDPEWWSGDQITSWLDSVLWVPHHVAALICCLFSFLLFWKMRDKGIKRRDVITTIALAGVSLASAFGLSVYVTLGFGLLMLCWCGRLILLEKRTGLVWCVLATGVLSLSLLTPLLGRLLTQQSGTGAVTNATLGHVLQFGIRKVIDPTLITELPYFSVLRVWHPVLLENGVRLALLALGMAVELGFFAWVLWMEWRRRPGSDEARRTALFLSVCGLTMVCFLRSAVIGNNDFGYRAALLPQFFLLLLASDYWTAFWARRQLQPLTAISILGASLFVLGLGGTIFQGLSLRLFLPVQEARKTPAYAGLGRAMLETREAYKGLASVIPAGAIVQARESDSQSFFDVGNMLYTPYGMALDAAPDCGAVFGGAPAACHGLRGELDRLYTAPATIHDAMQFCQTWQIDALVAVSRDAAWNNHAGWAWQLPALSQSDNIRVVACRSENVRQAN